MSQQQQQKKRPFDIVNRRVQTSGPETVRYAYQQPVTAPSSTERIRDYYSTISSAVAEDVPKNMNDDIEDEDKDEEKELTLFDQIRDALPAGVTTNAVFIYIFSQKTVPENIVCKVPIFEGY